MSGFPLLFVCHANLCRSPMAELLARLSLDSRPELRAVGLDTASAGTHARAGFAMHPHAARALAEWGVDSRGFRTRELTTTAIDRAVVVLTATRVQRAAVVSLVPVALPRAFTLRQFSRLAAMVEPGRLAGVPAGDRLAALIGEVQRVRGTLQPVSAEADDLADPVQGTLADFRDCARHIRYLLEPVWTVIAAA